MSWTTSRGVKFAMLADWGSWDQELKFIVADIRRRLMKLAGCDNSYSCVLMQGSGTFAVEAALGSFAPTGRRKMLMISNGAYGERAIQIMERLNRPYAVLRYADHEKPRFAEIEQTMDEDVTTADTTHQDMIDRIVKEIRIVERNCSRAPQD